MKASIRTKKKIAGKKNFWNEVEMRMRYHGNYKMTDSYYTKNYIAQMLVRTP